MRRTVIILLSLFLLLGCFASPTQSAQPNTPGARLDASLSLAGCPVFPTNNVWNTPVDTLPVDPMSDSYIQTIGALDTFHADFGSGKWNGFDIGIPYNLVTGNQTKVEVTFDYASESDPGPYPIPSKPKIEGDPDCCDRHILIVDVDNCILYELYDARKIGDDWFAGSGAIFDLNSNVLRPETWTSADAAGLPILPGLARYDEIESGQIDHAIRFTVSQTQRKYIWPARHFASNLTAPQYPPMGLRLRLKAAYDISGYPPQTQIVLQALKTYGIILADNGSNWFLSGAPDEGWDNDDLHSLHNLPGSAFEVVDTSYLMVDPDSGQAQIPTFEHAFLPFILR